MKMVRRKNINILICGLGIGNLYYNLLKNYYNVITIDIDKSKNPSYLSLDFFLQKNKKKIDLSIICTPNFLHETYIYKLSKISNIILVEKPGLKNLLQWLEAKKICKKLIMVKNNFYRRQLKPLNLLINDNLDIIDKINICWKNKNRIPSPGSWFTNKDFSFGGVSYDLMPHLLHILFGLVDYKEIKFIECQKKQIHSLDSLDNTDYGKINKDGVYNVDDTCIYVLKYKNIFIYLECEWKNDKEDKREILIEYKDNTQLIYKFGLCPDHIYKNMIDDILFNFKYDTHANIDEKVLEIIGNND